MIGHEILDRHPRHGSCPAPDGRGWHLGAGPSWPDCSAPNSPVAGNPGRVIRPRFAARTIARPADIACGTGPSTRILAGRRPLSAAPNLARWRPRRGGINQPAQANGGGRPSPILGQPPRSGLRRHLRLMESGRPSLRRQFRALLLGEAVGHRTLPFPARSAHPPEGHREMQGCPQVFHVQ